MSRNLRAQELTEAARSYIYAAAGTDLASLALKYVEQGTDSHIGAGPDSPQDSAGDDLGDLLPMVETVYIEALPAAKQALNAYDCDHRILVSYFRRLAPAEKEGVQIVADASKIFDVLSQFTNLVASFPWTDPRVKIRDMFPVRMGFPGRFDLDSIAVEEAQIEIVIKATHYA